MQSERPSVIERAFQIAKSGDALDIADVRSQLQAEGYSSVIQHLVGRSLTRQLSSIIAAARNPRLV